MKGQLLSGCRWLAFVVVFMVASCSKSDPDTISGHEPFQQANLKLALALEEESQCLPQYFDENILDSPCESTAFGLVIESYLKSFLDDAVFYDDENQFDFNIVDRFSSLNRQYITHYRGEVYFGKNGQFTSEVQKTSRKLDRFWPANRQIVINAQHVQDLSDRETLADMIESFDKDVPNREESYRRADLLLNLSSRSEVLPESPYFAMAAFSRNNGLIVLGDGVVETFISMGLDGKLAYNALLSHEWWHQVQYEQNWKNITDFSSASEFSKYRELQADFASAYFLTHKRGGAYNWKKIESFFEISYNTGDCFVQSPTHHGTPEERREAAKLGYQLASSAQRKGEIMSIEALNTIFEDFYY